MADRLARVEEMLQGSKAAQSNPIQAGSAPHHDFAAHPSSTQHQHDLSGVHLPSTETLPTSLGLAPLGYETSGCSGTVDHWRVSQDFGGPEPRFPNSPQVLNIGRTPQMPLSPTTQSTISHQASLEHLAQGGPVGPVSYPTNVSKDAPSSPDEIREGGSICSGDTVSQSTIRGVDAMANIYKVGLGISWSVSSHQCISGAIQPILICDRPKILSLGVLKVRNSMGGTKDGLPKVPGNGF
jgi:hypothetical protein